MSGITRRQFGAAAGIVGIGGPSGLTPVAALAADPPPKRGGVWRIARNRTVPGMDVQRVSEHFTSLTSMYDYLVEGVVDPKTYELKLLPGLATSWQFENDDKRVIFNLRRDVEFQDGSKFNAAVAKWNLDRMRGNPRSFLASNLTDVSNVKVLNDYTVAIELQAPSSPLLYVLSSAYSWGGMVSQAFQEKFGDDELNRKGCGSGAFRLKTWLVDDRVVLERNPNYWKRGVDNKPLPYLDGMEDIYRPKIDQATIELRTGAVDSVHFPVPRDVATMRRDPNLEYVELPPGEYQDGTCGFNQRKGPFTNINLRKACCYAIDRERLAKIAGFGIARPHAFAYVREGMPGWSPKDWPDYSYNAAKAKELLATVNPRGVNVSLSVIAREPDVTYGELFKAMWDAVGVRTELRAIERLEWLSAMKKDNYEACMWQGSVFPGGFVRDRLFTGAPSNWTNISLPALDKALIEDSQTLSTAKRHEIMKNAFKMLYEEALITNGTATTYAVGSNKKVRGVRSYWRVLVANEIWMA